MSPQSTRMRHGIAEVRAQNLNVTLQTTPGFFQRAIAKVKGKTAVTSRSRHILNDVSVVVRGPSLTALVGPSGSGKTTLLNALSGRLAGSELELRGETAIMNYGPNTNPSNHASASKVAYVRQEDRLFPTLTVRETLEYAADLSLNPLSRSERAEAVEKVVNSLRLGHCANTRIGDDSQKGCSGGEIRRTSIGVQILKEQPILFLDEPTTGLDPKAALETLTVLRNLVEDGKTVVMTLHQPRSEVWSLIDNLVVMSQGSVLYEGDLQYSLEHFAAAGWTKSPFENPFDFISDLIAVDTRNKSAEEISQDRIQALRSFWTECNSTSDQTLTILPPAPSPSRAGSGRDQNELWKMLLVHCRRTLRMTLRDRLGVVASLLEGLCMGVACGLVFYQLDGDLAGIRSRQGALYCTSSMQSYLVLLYETYRLTADLAAFDQEREDSVVLPTTFYWSRRLTRCFIEDVPTPLIFSTTFYLMAGLRSGVSEFFSYFLVQLLLHFLSLNLAMCCAAPTRDFMQAGLIANLNYVVQCLCAGLFINAKNMGPWIGWLRWVTQLRYAFGALCSNEFSDNFYDCPWPNGAANRACQEYTGDFIMASLDFPARWFATPIAALCGFAAAYSALAIGLLHLAPSVAAATPHVKTEEIIFGSVGSVPMAAQAVRVTLDKICVQIYERDLFRRKKPSPVVGPVSVELKPGTLTAILGPSGSGKTTLLNAVAGRLRDSARNRYMQTGYVRFNGRLVGGGDLPSACSFVPQNDTGLLHHLTVRETLHYAARLRLPASLSEKEKKTRADTILLELGLKPCADTIVGNTRLRGISGGEKRRLSIAVQMLTNPAVLLLDEPTSGLDAFMASTIIQALRNLANEGRTIVMVIHQPRWAFMQTCNKLLMLAFDGRPAFFGSKDELCTQLKGSHLSSSLPTVNPADLVLDRLADGTSISWYSTSASADVCLDLEQPGNYVTSGTSLHSLQKGLDERIAAPAALGLGRHDKLGFDRVLRILMQRGFANLRRAPLLLLGRVAQIVGTGIIVVLFFTPLKYDSPSAQTRVGIIAQSSSLFFVGMLNTIALYPAELDLFLCEFGDGVYGPEAFLSSWTLIEVPLEILSALLLSLLVVLATGLSDKFEVYILIAYTSFAVISCGESLGIVFLSFIEHTGLAISIMSVVLSMCTALNGAFSLNMPKWVQALNSLSPSKWQVQAAASSSLRSVQFSCDDAAQSNNGTCPISTGEQLLELYNLDVPTTKAACILAAVTFGYRILAYIALKYRCKLSK